MKTKKPLLAITGLIVLALFFVFVPPKQDHAQATHKTQPVMPIGKGMDSIAYYQSARKRQDSINLMEARGLTPLTVALNRKKRRKATLDKVAVEPTAVLRYNGAIYEPEVEKYRGYFIIDLDSFLLQNEDPEIINEPVDTPKVKTSIQSKKTFLQKLFSK